MGAPPSDRARQATLPTSVIKMWHHQNPATYRTPPRIPTRVGRPAHRLYRPDRPDHPTSSLCCRRGIRQETLQPAATPTMGQRGMRLSDQTLERSSPPKERAPWRSKVPYVTWWRWRGVQNPLLTLARAGSALPSQASPGAFRAKKGKYPDFHGGDCQPLFRNQMKCRPAVRWQTYQKVKFA